MADFEDHLDSDVWSPSLRDDLFTDYGFDSTDLTLHSLSFPNTSESSIPPLQQQRGNDSPNHFTFNAQDSETVGITPSLLGFPGFPLAPDPRRVDGRPLPLPLPAHSTQQQQTRIRNLPNLPNHPSRLSFSSHSSGSHDSTIDSEGESDTYWPDSDQHPLNDFVDLTEEPSPPPSIAPVRSPASDRYSRSQRSPRVNTLQETHSQPSPETPSNPAKRRKTGMEASQSSQRSKNIEEVDLIDVDDDKGLSKVLEQQRMATIKAQQDQANKPVRLSSLQCIICMDKMKDITSTSCGHLFCHSCLMEALIAGENQGPEPGKGVAKCPVCRKKLIRPQKGDKRDLYHVIPLQFKVRPKNTSSKEKENEGSSKGKEKEVS